MKFEWDEAKRQSNIHKHGIDFTDVAALFDGISITILDDRVDYGEDRFLTFGMLNGIVLAIVHTETDTVIRIISARKATRNEEKNYFREITN